MIKKLRNYVDELFEEKPKTKKVIELKDELIANLIEKYNDLLSKGKSEEEAYNIVVASIGDISELIGDLNNENSLTSLYVAKERKKNAKYVATAVMLYILSVVPVILLDYTWGADEIGVIIMFVMVAIATGMLVYVGVSKTKYLKEDDTLVEEFKEWKSHKNVQKSIKSAVLTSFWFFIVAIYLIISFAFQIWSYSWIIFIIAAAINQIIIAVFELRGE